MQELLKYRRVIFASTVGNVLEWYDFIAFGYLMGVISRHFFPVGAGMSATLLTAATFGVSFVARPVGGIVLGIYADRVGRKAALLLVIVMMTVATAMIGFAPTYSQAGVAATIIMVLARVLQGISAGGEFGSATSMLIEYAPANQKGLFGSFQMFAQAVAGVLASLAGVLITQGLTPAQLESWGWRLPFLFGLLIGPVGLYIRHRVDEPEVFRKTMESGGKLPFGKLLSGYWREMTIAGALVAGTTIMQFVFNIYMPTYAVNYLHMSAGTPFVVIALSGVVRILACPAFGALSDRTGRRSVLAWGFVGSLLAAWPCFAWLKAVPTLATLLMIELIFGVLGAAVLGPLSTALAEMFPIHGRSSGLAVSYNVSTTIFGGFTPLIVTWLIVTTGDRMAPAWYVIFGAALGLAAALKLAGGACEPQPVTDTPLHN
ncbi:Proline/betaine transporter [Paraburkholderia caffeinitolerans]|uniref:Proline/betaine transporter n=1 Tax=Paraburkholderia caffeinitolerans TaxID=1723730 RepID=A0A6J5GIP2_9BURK|nr:MULTISPECIES: MFS transporter [Paraburkholderia]CAB3798791.1 Proline/betaine transporter [Paraburkholderia caffeinitolerans]